MSSCATMTSDLDPSYRYINDNAKCPNCEDDSPLETSIKCFKCEKFVHALCKDSTYLLILVLKLFLTVSQSVVKNLLLIQKELEVSYLFVIFA